MNHMRKKRDAMIEKLHAEVGINKLIVCMMLVFQKRRERAGQDPEHFGLGGNLEQMLDEFLQSSSMRQLRMLREMASGIDQEVITNPQKIKEIRAEAKKVDVITTVVKPPTAH